MCFTNCLQFFFVVDFLDFRFLQVSKATKTYLIIFTFYKPCEMLKTRYFFNSFSVMYELSIISESDIFCQLSFDKCLKT